jgi:ankyrin repeat protein
MPIHFAAWADQVEIVRLLLARRINVDTRSKQCGETPLHVAAKKGALRTIAYLASQGADLNSTSRDGLTPARLASRPPHSTDRTLALLLSLGARK